MNLPLIDIIRIFANAEEKPKTVVIMDLNSSFVMAFSKEELEQYGIGVLDEKWKSKNVVFLANRIQGRPIVTIDFVLED